MENQNGYQSPEERPEVKKKKPAPWFKVAILVALLVLLVVGILLPIKLVPNAVSSLANTLSSIFIPNREVKLSTDRSEINTGEQFTIKWNGKHRTDGTYSLSYECADGLRLETSVNQPNETISCGSTYYFSPNDNSIDVTAYSESNRYTDLRITIGFLENGAQNLDELASLTITVTNPALSGTSTGSTNATSTPTVVREPVDEGEEPLEEEPAEEPTTPRKPSKPVSNPNGLADLEFRPMAVGYLDQNGNFIPSTTVAGNQQAAVKFQIINAGDKNTGTWSFVADLPSQTDPRYVSGPQQNLGPLDRIEYVLGFKNVTNMQSAQVTIHADQSNLIPESSDTNNVGKMYINNVAGSTGNSDLVVRIVNVGVINRSTGAYSPSSTVNAGDRVGVRFEVENIGANTASNWKFRATLPATDTNNVNYISESQPNLAAGQKFTFTIGFDNVRFQGNNNVTIIVDSENQVTESNENNNSVSGNINRN